MPLGLVTSTMYANARRYFRSEPNKHDSTDGIFQIIDGKHIIARLALLKVMPYTEKYLKSSLN